MPPLPKVPNVPPPRACDRTEEERKAICDEEVRAHFHKEKPKKPVYTAKQVAYAKDFLNTPSQYDLHQRPDDYTRTLARIIQAKKKEMKEKEAATSSAPSSEQKKDNESSTSRKRKDVPQLGEQNQSIPPLKVLDVPSVYKQQGGLDYGIARKIAAEMNCSVEALLGPSDDALGFRPVAPKYVRGAELVSKNRLDEMPTHLRQLHEWYLHFCERDSSKLYIVANIPEEYYFRREDLHIELCELWQLFNLDALDKSLMS